MTPSLSAYEPDWFFRRCFRFGVCARAKEVGGPSSFLPFLGMSCAEAAFVHLWLESGHVYVGSNASS